MSHQLEQDFEIIWVKKFFHKRAKKWIVAAAYNKDAIPLKVRKRRNNQVTE